MAMFRQPLSSIAAKRVAKCYSGFLFAGADEPSISCNNFESFILKCNYPVAESLRVGSRVVLPVYLIPAIKIGNHPPDDVNTVIEVPIGGEPIKYEMDKEAGTLVVDRFRYTYAHVRPVASP